MVNKNTEIGKRVFGNGGLEKKSGNDAFPEIKTPYDSPRKKENAYVILTEKPDYNMPGSEMHKGVRYGGVGELDNNQSVKLSHGERDLRNYLSECFQKAYASKIELASLMDVSDQLLKRIEEENIEIPESSVLYDAFSEIDLFHDSFAILDYLQHKEELLVWAKKLKI